MIKDILTITEAAEMWGISVNTIKARLQRGPTQITNDLHYKKSGKVWLITLEGMKILYGEPGTKEE